MNHFPGIRLAFACAAACLLGGCTKEANPARGGVQPHVHTAPHGGTLVELGQHAYSLELVGEPAAGKLTIYILDGHAENFIRIKAGSFEATAVVAGETRALTFKAVANAATGETAGDTAQFEAQAEWLKTAPSFALTIPKLDVRGSAYTGITLPFSPTVR